MACASMRPESKNCQIGNLSGHAISFTFRPAPTKFILSLDAPSFKPFGRVFCLLLPGDYDRRALNAQ